MKVVLICHLTLDGVMQAPGRADEDMRGGFEHGGWALPYGDAVMGEVMGRGMSGGGALLLGRRTYEDFFAVWPGRTDNPFTDVLNATRKYVASTTLKAPLPWINSTLLNGDADDAVAELKAQGGQDLHILGSGVLAGSLMRRGLIDDFVLTIHPLVLGQGRRLFTDDGPFSALKLTDSKTTTTGVVIAFYQRAEAVA
ncbi:MAG TPA: dihydrofolate reductase family protein [Caulobacteraceae bacterium]|jgi:dihydrofolate reductase